LFDGFLFAQLLWLAVGIFGCDAWPGGVSGLGARKVFDFVKGLDSFALFRRGAEG